MHAYKHTLAVTKITLYKTQCTIPNMSNVTKATHQLVYRQATAHRVRPTSRSGLTRQLTMMSSIAAYQPYTLSLYLTKTTVHWILTSKSMTIHVLQSTNAGGPTAVGGQEHDYHVLESTNTGGPTAVGGQEPQDYEIPLS